MSVAKRPPLPLILLAHNLLDGEVVFAAADGWTRVLSEARVAQDEAAAAALWAFGLSEVAARRVLELEWADVTITASGAPEPRHYRLRLKVLGPSNRPDLGKQAALQN